MCVHVWIHTHVLLQACPSQRTPSRSSHLPWLRQGPSCFCWCTGFSTLAGCHHGITGAHLPSHLFVCLLFFDGGSKHRIQVKCFYSLSYFPGLLVSFSFFFFFFCLKYSVLFVKKFSISAIFFYLIAALKYWHSRVGYIYKPNI